MENSVDRLRREFVACLKHKWPNQRLTIEFRHDVYNYLFHGKGTPAEQESWTIFEEGHLNLCKLLPNGKGLFDQNGDGVKMMFAIKMKKYLGRSPKNFQRKAGTQSIVETPRSYVGKISICFVKVDCGLE